MSPAENMDRLRRLLASAESDLAAECLSVIEGGEVVVNNRGRTEAATYHHVHSSLRDRYREYQGDEAGIVGYDQTLSRLAALDEEVWSESVVAPRCVYVVFSTFSGGGGLGECVGVLRNPNHNLSLLDGLRIMMTSRPGLGEPESGARFRCGEWVEA